MATMGSEALEFAPQDHDRTVARALDRQRDVVPLPLPHHTTVPEKITGISDGSLDARTLVGREIKAPAGS